MADDDEGIHRVDTVPPPDGEGDAYNAPTRVGAGPPEAILESLRHAAATGLPLKPPSIPRTPASTPDAAPEEAAVPKNEPPAPAVSAVPKPASDAPVAAPGTGTLPRALLIALVCLAFAWLLLRR